MSKPEIQQTARRRLRVAELHPHLMCLLCGGYYVDATTIIECLHSFCKSCLVRYLESSKYCPICEVQVHITTPLLNIRADETLQNMVYKLVPGLFQREMKSRQEFYAQHPEAPPSSPEDRGVIDPIECQFYSPEEPVSLALDFKVDDNNSSNTNVGGVHRRYLRCPAAVTVAHLQKLVRNKYDLAPCFKVDVMFEGKSLMPDLSIMDIAYSFQRKRKEQFHFSYRIVDAHCKRMKLEPPSLKENPVNVEPMNVDPEPPTSAPLVSIPHTKAVDFPQQQPETKSKLDSIISRLGIAKQSENILKKEKSSDEWKEVQLQISENGVMSVTDISSVDKLTNALEKNAGLNKTSKSKVIEAAPKTDLSNKKQIPDLERKRDSISVNFGEDKNVPSAKVVVKDKVVKDDGISFKRDSPSEKGQSAAKEDRSELIISGGPVKKGEVSDTRSISSPLPNSPLAKVTAPTVHQSTPLSRVQTSTSSIAVNRLPPVVASGNIPAAKASKSPSVTSEASHASPSISSSSPVISSVSSTLPCVIASSTATSKPSSSALTSTTVSRAAPVSVTKQVTSTTNTKKSSSSPAGYKTLKCGPKNWYPTISRNSFLSSKMDQQPHQQAGSTSSAGASSASVKPSTPPRFFKMRNAPRYLGNPASGVKAMYQIPDSKPETPTPAKSPSLMKLDPRTLTPIVSNASSPTQKSPANQPKGRPPFPSTTLSAQVSNHMPSSRSVATTTTTTTSSTKMTDLTSLRSSPNQPMVNPYLPNPFVSKGMPNFLFGGMPGLLPGPQFASMLRPGLGYPPVTASGFHPSLPQTPSMLFSPHQLHRQLNSSSPGSPLPYPSALVSSSPSMSLSLSSSSSCSSLSKSNTVAQRISVSCEKSSSTHSAQSSPNRNIRSNATVSSPSAQESVKLNGTEMPKSSVTNKSSTSSSESLGQSLSQGKAMTTSASTSKESRSSSISANDNNNTLSLSASKLKTDKLEITKVPLDVPKSLSKETAKCGDELTVPNSKSSSGTSVQAQPS